MRTAVTGASGFTGQYLMRALQARGHDPVALTSDITDRTALRHEIENLRPDTTYHLAASAFVASDDLDQFYQVNQIGTFHLLDSLADICPGSSILLASTAQVYGGASGLIDESVPIAPVNHYGVSKAAMELGANVWRDRLRIIIARPFNYTGQGQEERYLVAKVVAHFRRRAPEIMLGNIDVKRDFGDVRAVVDAYCRLMESDTAPDIYNICTGQLTSVREIIALASDITGYEPTIGFNPAFARGIDPETLGGINRRLRQTLPGWRPHALRETLEWMLEAPAHSQ